MFTRKHPRQVTFLTCPPAIWSCGAKISCASAVSMNPFKPMRTTNSAIECEKQGCRYGHFRTLALYILGTAQSLKVFYRKQCWHGTHVVKVFLRDVLHSDNKKAVLFATYTLTGVVALVVASAMALLQSQLGYAHHRTGCVVVAASVDGVTAKFVAKQEVGDFIPLATLYLVYGLARARALLNAI